MYLIRIEIKNVRCLREVSWKAKASSPTGWHVILGDNGAGKSTFIRAAALALVGPQAARALREDWDGWLRRGERSGHISLLADYDKAYDKFAGQGANIKNWFLFAGVSFARTAQEVTIRPMKNADGQRLPSRHLWSGKPGWFSCSYDPFRRFSGGDKDYEKIYYSNPLVGRHLSAFVENVALTESLEWLMQLQFESLEGNPEGYLLEDIKGFINQPDFLPEGARLESVTSKGVFFVDAGGARVDVSEMSDGFRSILSMTFELIRQLARAFPVREIFYEDDAGSVCVRPPGVVLIDEIDAHLHPNWQRRVGGWFTKHFPNVQFIVSTHSPFVCQSSDVGSIWRLPDPGRDDPGGPVRGEELKRLLYGDILDA